MGVSLTFRLFKGDELLRELTLSQPVIKVGKVPSSHLRIDDESVSRMHAVIEATSPSDVRIIDLGSTGGTFVNDAKINKATLASGDVIKIGETRIEVTIADVAVAVEAPPPKPAAAPPPKPTAAAAAPPPPPAAAMAAPPEPVAPPPVQVPGIVAPPGHRHRAAAPYVAPYNPHADQVEESGARAVEVAAMLGDSVVGVKHCMNPRSTGKVTPLTYALFALGAVLLAVGIVSFSLGVRTASQNEHAMKHWTKPIPEGGLGKPAYSFRPKMSKNPVLDDLITFGGMLGGVFLLAWGLSRARNDRRSPWFRVGQNDDVDYASTDAPAGSFAMIAPSGDDFVLHLAPGMDAELTLEGQTSATPLTASETKIPLHARIRVKNGMTTFLVSSVAQPKKHPVPLFAGLEANVLAYFAGSAIFFLGAWALLRTAHGGLDTANGDDDTNESVALNGDTTGEEDPPPEPEEEQEEQDTPAGSAPGAKAALEEGKSGKETADVTHNRTAIKNNGADNQIARQQALAAAKTAGILGSESFATASFSSLTGTSTMSSGPDDIDAWGDLNGGEPGDSQGFGGQGMGGYGPGGGGNSWGTIGTGRYGTIGGGNGAGEGFQPGGGSGHGGRHKPSVPSTRIGQPSGSGDLDKATIRRYIKRNLPKIKYCYEKELLASPGLSGTVDVQFLINPNGTVGEVHAKGINGEVSDCVKGVIKAIEFPKPKGGGPVNVTSYPFEFHPSGG